MATTINNRISSDNASDNNPLNVAFTRTFTLNWQVLIFTLIFVVAMFTRFYDLGERLMSHDESLHTQFSYNLATEGNFRHTPLMHGPILFHMTALSYTLFGDDDFTSRIYSAAVGVMIVMSPFLFRRWIGRWGAILAAIMLLISPLMMYYSRYIRHDMPSIMSAILMAWAIFMYLNGPPNQRRRAHWLYILSIGMIWNLGSKETAFMYIAIFGAFLTLYWMVRLLQYYYDVKGQPLFYTLSLGIMFAVFASLMMILVVSIGLGNTFVTGDTLTERLTFIGNQTDELLSGNSVTDDFATFARWTILAIVSVIGIIVGPALWAYRRQSFQFSWVDLSVVMLGLMTFFVLGTLDSLGLGFIGIILIGLAYAWYRLLGKRNFGRQITTMLVIATVLCIGLLLFEEISHEPSRVTSESLPEQQPAPDGGVADTELVVIESDFSILPIALEWTLAIIIIGLLIYSRRTKFWQTLNLFPEFDILLLMGTLILPWLTAVFIFLTHGNDSDFIQIANDLPEFIHALVPTGVSSPTQETLRVGQVFIGFLAWIPMMTIAVVVGLMWNWRRWLVCSAIFHAIFAFFFTTVFTNIEGLASGMIYSLQYWLEQQGERRGSQPQYYYMVVILPFYEFLPIVGGFLAMLAGMVFFWRKRRAFDAEMAVDDVDSIAIGSESISDELVVKTKSDKTLPDELPPMWLGLAFAGIALVSFFAFIIQVNSLALTDVFTIDGELVQSADDPTLAIVLFSVFIVNALAGLMWLGRYFHGHSSNVSDITDDAYTLGEVTATAPILGVDNSDLDISDDFDVVETSNPSVRRMTNPRWQLHQVPFILFLAWWGVFNIYAYTLSGEKMPWLGTHMTVPLIFLSAWYFNPIFEKIKWRKFVHRGWIYLILFGLLFAVLFQVIAPLAGADRPFQGTTRAELQATYTWFGMVVVAGIIIYAIVRLVEQTGWAHLRRMFAVSAFIFLSILTFRSALMASFINYDKANEFLVYAHAGPGNGIVYDQLREISLLTTGGMDIAYAYDDGMSWPGSWYFRHFTYPGFYGENPTYQRLEGVVAVAVRGDGLAEVEPLLEDEFQRFEYIRMWWPMQDYYNLNAGRVNDLLNIFTGDQNAAARRQGIWDIWWQRDYTSYGRATNSDFSETNWPVSDRVYLFIRRDVAAQVWQYGIGEGTVGASTTSQQTCATPWEPRQASVVFDTSTANLYRPIGIDIGSDGNLYVADEGNTGAGIIPRIHVFTTDGQYETSFGQSGTAAELGAFFERPHSVAFSPDGTFYVADTWNYRIRQFAISEDGYTYLNGWGQPLAQGAGAPRDPVDGFWGPRDIVVDALGRVFVSDTGNKRIRVYDATGNFIRDIGEGGSLPGQLDEPAGLAVHPDGRLFVADTWNRRISVFSVEGVPLTSFRVRGWASEPANRPYLGLDVERDILYVTDPDAGRIFMYDTAGNCLGSFGQLNVDLPNDTQFSAIGGITVDEAGNVYVADLGSSRILRFDPWDRPDLTLQDAPIDIQPQVEVTEEILVPEATEELGNNDSISVPLDIAESTDEPIGEMTEPVEPEGAEDN